MDTPAALRTALERLIGSDRLTAPTRAALKARLERRYGAPKLLSTLQMATLRAVAARLIPSPELVEAINLAGAFDAALSDGPGDGWRYATLPPDRESHPAGLDALDREARARFAVAFADVAPEAQDDLLRRMDEGELNASGGLDLQRWFEHLLARLVELYYGHPLVQLAIGYDGMADARGVQAVSLADVAAGPALG